MRQKSAGRVYGFRGPSFRAALLLCFAAAAGFLFFGRSNTPIFEGLRRLVEGATGGFYEFVGPPVVTARHFISDMFRVVEVYGENDRLRAENAELKAWRAQALALQQKVTRYEALLEMPLEPDIQYRTGRVVDDPGGPFVRTFRINLGTKNGVVEGQAVMDERGLVGRIVSAGRTASRILLITDLNSRVPVMIEPSGVRGMLVGQNDAPPVVTYLPKDVHVAAGNLVMTSGHGGLLPPNIPVGVVTAVKEDKVIIKPATQLASVTYVRVLDYTSPAADVPYSTKGPPILNATPAAAAPASPVASAEPAPSPPAPALASRPPQRETPARPNAPERRVKRVTPIESEPIPAPATAGAVLLPATPAAANIGGFE